MRSLTALTLLAAALLVSPVFAEEENYGTEEMDPETAAMMEAWTAAMTPGDAHAQDAEKAGNWNLAMTMWGMPDADPVTSTGTATIESILGGRYLLTHVTQTSSPDSPMPFEGHGMCGYNNVTRCYEETWADCYGTGILSAQSEPTDPDPNHTLSGEYVDPITGETASMSWGYTKSSPDSFSQEIWMPGPDGTPYLTMLLEYTRA